MIVAPYCVVRNLSVRFAVSCQPLLWTAEDRHLNAPNQGLYYSSALEKASLRCGRIRMTRL